MDLNTSLHMCSPSTLYLLAILQIQLNLTAILVVKCHFSWKEVAYSTTTALLAHMRAPCLPSTSISSWGHNSENSAQEENDAPSASAGEH